MSLLVERFPTFIWAKCSIAEEGNRSQSRFLGPLFYRNPKAARKLIEVRRSSALLCLIRLLICVRELGESFRLVCFIAFKYQ